MNDALCSLTSDYAWYSRIWICTSFANHPADGILKNKSKIGDIVEKGQVIAVIEASDKENESAVDIKKTGVTATIDGLLRGLIRDNYPVTKGFKIADIDPRKEELANCFTITDKARCIAGSVLEVICETLE